MSLKGHKTTWANAYGRRNEQSKTILSWNTVTSLLRLRKRSWERNLERMPLIKRTECRTSTAAGWSEDFIRRQCSWGWRDWYSRPEEKPQGSQFIFSCVEMTLRPQSKSGLKTISLEASTSSRSKCSSTSNVLLGEMFRHRQANERRSYSTIAW